MSVGFDAGHTGTFGDSIPANPEIKHADRISAPYEVDTTHEGMS
jgi:hypothetical protein